MLNRLCFSTTGNLSVAAYCKQCVCGLYVIFPEGVEMVCIDLPSRVSSPSLAFKWCLMSVLVHSIHTNLLCFPCTQDGLPLSSGLIMSSSTPSTYDGDVLWVDSSSI